MKTESKSGITIVELKKFLLEFPSCDTNGDPTEVWIDNGNGTSSPCTKMFRLNKSDILLG